MLKVSKESRLIPRDKVVYRAVIEGGILVDLETGACFKLNRIGAEIWAGLAAGGTISQTTEAVRLRYEVAIDVLELDAVRLFTEFVALGLATTTPETPPPSP
jgi:hypothetical protein